MDRIVRDPRAGGPNILHLQRLSQPVLQVPWVQEGRRGGVLCATDLSTGWIERVPSPLFGLRGPEQPG